MEFPLDDDAFQNGFCWGLHEVTVDNGPRIRLPAAVTKILKEFGVKELWIYRDPTGPRLIICPGQNRKAYIKAMKQSLPASMQWDKAYRTYICTGEAIPFRGHGRIPISASFRGGFRARPGQQIVILGTGLWYELWQEDDWFDNSDT